MESSLSDAVTVIIPTCNRPKYLKRSLDYWGRTDFNVLVADGGVERYDGKIPPNISYFYDNLSSPGERWLNSVQKVNTRYVVLCADDDFLTVRGLHACVAFLEGHSDYVSAQGHAILFKIKDRENISIEALNAFMVGHKIDGATAKERLRQLFNEYIYQIYSVYHTPILQQALETCKDQKNGSYIELSAALIPSIFGKHKVVPVFYSAREHLVGASSSTIEALRFDILNLEGLADYVQWRDKVALVYSDAEGVSLDKAVSIVENTFNRYCAWDLRVYPYRQPLRMDVLPTSLSVLVKTKTLLRRMIGPVLSVRKNFFGGGRASGKTTGVCDSPGFPWSDPEAASDWKQMVKIVNYHLK